MRARKSNRPDYEVTIGSPIHLQLGGVFLVLFGSSCLLVGILGVIFNFTWVALAFAFGGVLVGAVGARLLAVGVQVSKDRMVVRNVGTTSKFATQDVQGVTFASFHPNVLQTGGTSISKAAGGVVHVVGRSTPVTCTALRGVDQRMPMLLAPTIRYAEYRTDRVRAAWVAAKRASVGCARGRGLRSNPCAQM